MPENSCAGTADIAPFRYIPNPDVIAAAKSVIQQINAIGYGDESGRIALGFSEGKMLGVLVAEDCNGRKGYLAGFSGSAGGKNIIRGFVPPIYDLLNPNGHFRQKEAEITAVNSRINELEDALLKDGLRQAVSEMKQRMEEELISAKAKAKLAKEAREKARKTASDASLMADLDRQSQFIKAEQRRLKARWQEKLSLAEEALAAREEEIRSLRSRRAAMSDALQKWIFSQYMVHDGFGNICSISEIFRRGGTVPPGGTGECAAPKMLEYARRNGLRPIAMGEFWYGQSPETAVRTHGHFYPSCTSKCGPLLNFMLNGPECSGDSRPEIYGSAAVLYEDDAIIVASKPSGMPSVKSPAAGLSLEEWLGARYDGHGNGELPFTVHRLDMDTSGIMLFAKTQEAATILMKQFEDRTVRKTYKARLSAQDPAASSPGNFGRTSVKLTKGACGLIDMPLSPDYDERPRQKADSVQGKEAITEYEVTDIRPDGSTEVLFFPRTGRTHQLRVHSAHVRGLGRPIKGDMLYGGYSIFDDTVREKRLCLHALSITFRHPCSGEEMTFSTMLNSY